MIFVRFASGHEVSFPTKGNPRLETAAEEDVGRIEVSPFGLHWPTLDEDLRGGAPKNRGCKKDEAAEVPIEQPPMPGKTPYPGDLAAWRFPWQAVVCGVRLCVWSRLLRSNLLLRYSRQPRNTS